METIEKTRVACPVDDDFKARRARREAWQAARAAELEAIESAALAELARAGHVPVAVAGGWVIDLRKKS